MRLRALLFLALLFACRNDHAERDAVLKSNLAQIRAGIAAYQRDHGAYPPSLEALVPRYLRAIPKDPVTLQRNWRLETEETVQPSADFTTGANTATQSVITNVRSAAPGADDHGVLYSNY